MSTRNFVRTEMRAPVSGTSVFYDLDVPWQPQPRIVADANGIYLSGMHMAGTRENLNALMSCMEAAWSDHLVLARLAERGAATAPPAVATPLPAADNNVVALAHGKTHSEQGGSSV